MPMAILVSPRKTAIFAISFRVHLNISPKSLMITKIVSEESNTLILGMYIYFANSTPYLWHVLVLNYTIIAVALKDINFTCHDVAAYTMLEKKQLM